MSDRAINALVVGKRLFLQHPLEEDRAEFLTLRRSCRAFLEKWEPIPPPGFDAFGDEAFDRDLSMASTPTNERVLIRRLADDVIVGKLSFGDIMRGPAQFCHIGYWIGEQHTRRGYMTEAIGLGLRYAFETLELHRVEANIQPHNHPSKRVAAKCGFRLEGVSPRYIKIQGVWADHERWAVTVEEWEKGGLATDGRG
ncbi:MAG: GNAT family N-acetyltransferase [Phycisphaerales bacterium]